MVPEIFTGVVGIVIVAFLAALGVYWLLFPWFVYTKLDRLIAAQKETSAATLKCAEELTSLRLAQRSATAPPPEPAYWVRIGSDTNGPFPLDKIKELKKRGTIDDETPIAAEGTRDWKKVRDVAD